MAFHPIDAEHEEDEDIVAEINVTPLTDIFLVLLIIFMVTSTAMLQQGTAVNLPSAGRVQDSVSGVTVTVTRDGQIEVDGSAVTQEDLHTALTAALSRASTPSVVLRGDQHVVLEQAVQIMTVAREAGAQRIAIATAPSASE